MSRARILVRSLIPVAAVTAAISCCVAMALAQTPPRPGAPMRPAATTAPSATAPAKSGGDEVIARVGNTSLSAEDVRTYVAGLTPQDQAAIARDPVVLNQAVRVLLTNRLVLQEAQSKKFEQQPGVAAQLEQVRQNATIELYLQSVSAPPANYPSEDEIHKAYENIKGQLLVPRQLELSQVFVAIPKDADKAAEDKARQHVEDSHRKLKAPGADLAAIGGSEASELGWVAEPQLKPEIRTAVATLAKNAVSEPVRVDDGWHILKLMDVKAPYTRTLPEVHDQIVQQMRAERAGMLRRNYLTELQRQHPPVLNELALSGIYQNGKK